LAKEKESKMLIKKTALLPRSPMEVEVEIESASAVVPEIINKIETTAEIMNKIETATVVEAEMIKTDPPTRNMVLVMAVTMATVTVKEAAAATSSKA
jgi:hypothetical protein